MPSETPNSLLIRDIFRSYFPQTQVYFLGHLKFPWFKGQLTWLSWWNTCLMIVRLAFPWFQKRTSRKHSWLESHRIQQVSHLQIVDLPLPWVKDVKKNVVAFHCTWLVKVPGSWKNGLLIPIKLGSCSSPISPKQTLLVITHWLVLNHQKSQVPKLEVLYLIRLFWGWGFPYISLTCSLYVPEMFGDSTSYLLTFWLADCHKISPFSLFYQHYRFRR